MPRRNRRRLTDAEVFGSAFQQAYSEGAPARQRIALEELGRLTDQEGAALGAPAGLSRDLLGAFLQGRASMAENKRKEAQEARAAEDFSYQQTQRPRVEKARELQISSGEEELAQLRRNPGEKREESAQAMARVLASHAFGEPLTAMKILKDKDSMQKFVQDLYGAVHGKPSAKPATGGKVMGETKPPAFKTREEIGEAFKVGYLTKDQALAELKKLGK